MIDEGVDFDPDADRLVEASSPLIDCESLRADDSTEEEEESELVDAVGGTVGADVVVCGGEPLGVVLVVGLAGG